MGNNNVKDYPPYLDYPLKSANSFFGCGINNPRCKEDCYWYGEWQDMNARIPYCKCKKHPADTIGPNDCESCKQYHNKDKPSKADRIRAMSDEELADELLEWFACFYAAELSRDMILDWLKQEVKE